MAVDQKVLDRIQKLMTQAGDSGATRAESETAMGLAIKLMTTHNISLADITKEESGYEFLEVVEFGKFTLEHSLAYGIVCKFFYVRGITKPIQRPGHKRRSVLHFFGESTNVQTAIHVYKTLLNSFESLFIQHQIKTRCPQKERRAFIEGVAAGFIIKMTESLEESIRETGNVTGTGLALMSQQQKMIAKYEEFTKSQDMKLQKKKTQITQTNGSDATYAAGFNAGKNLNISKGIGASNTKAIR